MINKMVLANTLVSTIFFESWFSNFGVVNFSIINMYPIAQKENASVKLPNAKPDPGTERMLPTEILVSLLPLDIISNALAIEEALKNIHAKPTQQQVTNHAIKRGILIGENRSLKKSYINM
jgi:hypothetical protein